MTRRDARPSRRALLAGAAAAAALPGCAAVDLITPGPPQLYRLTPQTEPAAAAGPVVDWQLLVETPTAPAAIDTARIVVAPAPLAVDYFAGVAWIDRAPNMVQTLMIESFEASRRIMSVGREGLTLRADFVLRTELREFQAETAGAGGATSASVRMIARLVRMPQRTIVATESFEARAAAAAGGFEQVVRAFDAALGEVLRGMVEWTLASGAEASRRRAAWQPAGHSPYS